MQQLLQPLPSQLLGLSSILAAAATAAPAANRTSSSSNITQVVPAALSAAQEQLQLLTAGVVSSGSALMLSLLQLAAVLLPDGPTGVTADGAAGSREGDTAAAAAAMQVAFPAGSDQQRPPKWLLLPHNPTAELEAGAAAPIGSSSSSSRGGLHEQLDSLALTSQQQQQPGQFLVFRLALDPSVLHVLPLDLAVAVLQLLQHLVTLDSNCLSKLVAELAASASSHGSSGGCLQQQQSMSRRDQAGSSSSSLQWGSGSSGGSTADVLGHGSSSSRVQLEWCQGPPSHECARALAQHVQQQAGRGVTSRHLPGSAAGLLASGRGGWNSVSWPPPATSLVNPGASTAAGYVSSAGQQQQQQQRGVTALLADAARCHSLLLHQVGAVLASAAAELPASMQAVLLPAAVSDQGLLLLLLVQAEPCAARCAGAALLQQLLGCPRVAAGLAAALSAAAGSSANQQQQQQHQGNDDVIMIDVKDDQVMGGGALQPLDNRQGQAAARGTSAAGNSRAGKAQQGLGAAAAGGSAQQQQQLPAVAGQIVQEVLLQLLECFSHGLDDAFQTLQQPARQQQRQQQSIPAVLYATQYSSSSSSSSGVHTFQKAGVCGGAGLQAVQGWGVFELQRRCSAVFAGLLHSRQELLLLYSMDPHATAGKEWGCCCILFSACVFTVGAEAKAAHEALSLCCRDTFHTCCQLAQANLYMHTVMYGCVGRALLCCADHRVWPGAAAASDGGRCSLTSWRRPLCSPDPSTPCFCSSSSGR